MLDVGLSSTDRVAAFFGIAAAQPAAARGTAVAEHLPPPKRLTPDLPPLKPDPASAAGIQKVIQDALRSAGLMQ
jgi:hypothetical protein